MTTHQAGRPRVTIWTREGGKEVVDALVLGFETSETLQPPQRFSLMLGAPQGPQSPANIRFLDQFSRRVRPNSVVSIGWDQPGDLFFGLVDEIRREVSYGGLGGGPVSYTLSITGSDLVGKALSRDNILLSLLSEVADAPFFAHMRAVLPPDPLTGLDHPILLGIESALGPVSPNGPDRGVNLFTGKTVQEVVNWILTQIPAMRFPVLQKAFGGTGRVGEFVVTDATTFWNDQRMYSESPQTFAGNLLGFVRSIIDEDFYEVFTTSIPTLDEIPTGVLVVRPKPFDDPLLTFAPVLEDPGISWQRLKTRIDGELSHIIETGDIIRESAGWSDAQAFAYYTCSSAHDLVGNDAQDQLGIRYPLIDTYNLVAYGAASYQSRTTLVGGLVNEQVDENPVYESEIPSVARELRNRLFNWNRLNPWFVNGETTIIGRPKMRVGDPVQFIDWAAPLGPEPGIRAYACAVGHAWSVGQAFTTRVQFTRGYNALYVQAIKTLIAEDAAIYPVVPSHFVES